MKTTLDHINNAIDELEMAKDKAPFGTRLMVQEILGDSRRLRDRVEEIVNDAG